MKAFYIPIALLAVMLIASLWFGHRVQQNVTPWVEQLEEVLTLAENDRWDEAHQQLLAVLEDWSAHSETFHMFLKHQDLDETDTLFVGVIAACREQDSVELHIHLQQLILHFKLLSETQQATWENIL